MKQSTSALRQLYVNSKAAVCVGLSILTAIAPSLSLALEVQVQRTVNLRTEDSTVLRKVGKLAAGSVVSIPDQYAKRNASGAIDFELTLNNWLSSASNLTNEAGMKNFTETKKDFYFPIKVVKAAPGSELGDKDSYMVALHYLHRKGALLETTQDTDLMEVAGTEVTTNAEVATSQAANVVSSAVSNVVAPSAAPATSARNGEFEASAVSVCTNCETQNQYLHPLAGRLQASLDSHLRHPLSKMAARTVNHTSAAERTFEKTCGMRMEDFIPQLRNEIARSTLKSSALTTPLMLSLMTQETNGNCKKDGDHRTSIGLFQVNGRSSGYSTAALRNPVTNVRAALNNLEGKQRALSKEFDFSKMSDSDRMRLLISAYNGGEKWVTRAKDDLLQFNRKQGTTLNPHNWEHLRIFYFRRHLNRSNEYHAFGTVRGRDQRSEKNALNNLAYTENLIPRYQTAYGKTVQEAWHQRISG